MRFQSFLLAAGAVLLPSVALATSPVDLPECVDGEFLDTGVEESYIVRPWKSDDHAITLKNFEGCSNVDWQFFGDSGRLTLEDDGTATITGHARVENTSGSNCNLHVGDAWTLSADLSSKHTCLADSDWTCYDLDNGATFESTDGAYAVTLTQKGPDFQIGDNFANDKDSDFGASGWFTWHDVNSSASGHGDFNFDLDCSVCPTDADSYAVTDYSDATGAHGIWFRKDLFCTGKAARFTFIDGSRLEIATDGSGAKLEGYAKVKAGTDCTEGAQYEGTVWKVSANFGMPGNNTTGKKEQGQSDDVVESWDLFLLTNGTISRGSDEIVIQKMPDNGDHGLQVGDEANGKDGDFGASAWFTWMLNGTHGGTTSYYQGDFNIDLDLVCDGTPDNDSEIKFDPAAQSILAGQSGFNFHLQMGNPGGMPEAPWTDATLTCDFGPLTGLVVDDAGISKGRFATSTSHPSTGIVVLDGLTSNVINGQYFDVNIPASTAGMASGDYPTVYCDLEVPGALLATAEFDLNIRTQDNQSGGPINSNISGFVEFYSGAPSVYSNANQWYDTLHVTVNYGNTSASTIADHTIECALSTTDSDPTRLPAYIIDAQAWGGFGYVDHTDDTASFTMAKTLQPGQNRNLQIKIDDLYGDTNTELTCMLFDDEDHVLDSATVQIHN